VPCVCDGVTRICQYTPIPEQFSKSDQTNLTQTRTLLVAGWAFAPSFRSAGCVEYSPTLSWHFGFGAVAVCAMGSDIKGFAPTEIPLPDRCLVGNTHRVPTPGCYPGTATQQSVCVNITQYLNRLLIFLMGTKTCDTFLCDETLCYVEGFFPKTRKRGYESSKVMCTSKTPQSNERAP